MVEFVDNKQVEKDRKSTSADTRAQENLMQEGGTPDEGFTPKTTQGASQDVHDTPPGGSDASSKLENVKEEEDELTSLKEQLAFKEQEAQSYYDRLLRLQAEFENFRKRMVKEKAEFTKYANEELIKSLLPVLDNLERALASAEQTKDFEGLSKGVEMIFKQLYESLRKAGLSDIEALNQPFDPAVHQAVVRVESTEVENNTVVEVLQKGYYFHDRVLRPAMVKVATQSS